MQIIAKPLPLNGAKNIRDLGGYTTETGAVTKHHAFLRGDALHKLTKEDSKQLYDHGVRCIVDLRSEVESKREPDMLPLLYSDIKYIHVPIQDHVRANRYSDEFPPSMWELYCWLLDDSKESFYKVFKAMIDCTEACVLFHCSGGKDRTGMTAMLLLKLAGVDEETIIQDYAITQEYMKDIFPLQVAQLESMGLTVPGYVMESPPENMRKALDYLREHYISAENYLKTLGFTETEINVLRKKIVN
jgi:protein-tyrosine phosphatase